MLALTVRQPYAALILRGLKREEFRRFKLPVGIDIALHTSRALAGPEELAAARLACPGASDQAVLAWLSSLPRGKVVGVIRCTGHSTAPEGCPWGHVANTVEVVREFAVPIRAIGKQGLWEWEAPSSGEGDIPSASLSS